jgi:hypothetical protein
MSRLPTPGGDQDTWGDLLNDFLMVDHNRDGTHKPDVVPDSTASAKGKLRLSGDLSGTADSPTVPGLSSKVDTSIATAKGDLLAAATAGAISRLGVGSDGQVLAADSTQTLGLKWAAPTGSRSVTLVVAASDASAQSKASADYVCDGTSDEAEINAALAALPVNGGKLVLSEGTFNVASSILVQNDNATIVGAGDGQRSGATQTGIGTKLLAQSSITNAVVLVQRAADNRPVYGVLLRDFVVDGNLQGSAVDGILYRSNRGHIDHVHVHKCTGNGIRVFGYSSPSFDTYDTSITFCQVGDCAAAGIFLDSHANDDHIISCILYNNNYNILVAGSSAQITSCHTYNATTDNIKFDGGGSRTKIINCKIEGAGQNGINIDSTNGGYSDIQITGCGLSTNGDSLDNGYDHIVIQGPSANGVTRTMIVGNAFGHKNSVTANKCRYGVNMSSSCAQGTVVVSNSFAASPQFPTGTLQIQSAPINNNGSTTTPAFIRGNANAFDDPDDGIINVKKAPYGARGNGSTDDTAAIQAALNAVPVGGGIVYLPPGRYKITASLVIQADNTLLMGVGAGNRYGATQDGYGSRIEADSTLTGVPMIKVQRSALDRTIYGVKIRDVTIDGRGFGSGVEGIHWEVVRGELENVSVHNCTGYGLNVVGYLSPGNWQATDNRFIGCDFSYNLTGATFGTNAIYNKFIGCVFSNNTQDGISISQVGLQCDGCDFYSNARYGLSFDGGGSRSNITGSKFRINGQHGVNLDTTNGSLSDISFTGCTFATNGISATNSYSNVFHAGPSGNALSRVTYVGNNFLYVSGDSANKPKYGLDFSTTATQFAVVEGNTFGPASHWGTAAHHDAASSTNPPMTRNNVGWVTEANGTATVAAGTTSIAVTHGLSVTPALKDIHVTPNNSMNAATKFWVSGPTSTQFTINVDQSPGASSTATFAWQLIRFN